MSNSMNINDYITKCYNAAQANGWWDDPREFGTLLMLTTSELSEALEADRKGKRASNIDNILNIEDTKKFKEEFKENIKDTVEDEIADAFIRLFDLCGALKLDMEKHIEAKLRYNATRGYKHGKNY